MDQTQPRTTDRIERKTIDIDWSEEPLRCPDRNDLPAADPRSVQAVTRKAHERVLHAIESELAQGWELDGEPVEAITLERRKRRVLLPTPGTVGPEWEEFCAVQVRLRRN